MNLGKMWALAVVAGMTGFAGVANATAVPYLPACTLSDVTLEGNNANACAGANAGNVAGTKGATIIDGYFGSSWSYLTASDAGGVGTFNGIQFTLGGDSTGTSGSWTLSWLDNNGNTLANLPDWIDLAVVVKAGNGHAAYLFDDLQLTDDPYSGDGTWKTINGVTNRNGTVISGLSHVGLYVREGTCTSNCELDPPPTGRENPIPEPETLALVAVGLLGMIASLKRKVQRK